MNDDLMKMYNDIAYETEDKQRISEIEAYIERVVSNNQESIRASIVFHALDMSQSTRSEVEQWAEINKGRVSVRIARVLRAALRQELLGEK